MEKLKELGLDDEFGAIYDEEIVEVMVEKRAEKKALKMRKNLSLKIF